MSVLGLIHLIYDNKLYCVQKLFGNLIPGATVFDIVLNRYKNKEMS